LRENVLPVGNAQFALNGGKLSGSEGGDKITSSLSSDDDTKLIDNDLDAISKQIEAKKDPLLSTKQALLHSWMAQGMMGNKGKHVTFHFRQLQHIPGIGRKSGHQSISKSDMTDHRLELSGNDAKMPRPIPYLMRKGGDALGLSKKLDTIKK